MFYSQFLLSKKGPLGVIWIAAHLERKLKKKQITETDITESIDQILKADVPIALRLSSHLLIGVVRIFAKKVDYLFNDCSEALLKIRQAYRSSNIDLPPKALVAPYHTITLPESFDFDHLGDYLNDDDVPRVGARAEFDHHVTSRDLITLQEPYQGRHSLYAFDGDFLEGPNPYTFSPEDGVHTGVTFSGRVSMGGGAHFEASYEDVLPPLPLPMEEEMGLFNVGGDEEHQVSSELHTEQTVSCGSPAPEFGLDVQPEPLKCYTEQTVSCSSPDPVFRMDVHPEALKCHTEQTVSCSSPPLEFELDVQPEALKCHTEQTVSCCSPPIKFELDLQPEVLKCHNKQTVSGNLPPPEFRIDVHPEALKCHTEQTVSCSSPSPEFQMNVQPQALKCNTEEPVSCGSPLCEFGPDVQSESLNITKEVEYQAILVEEATVHNHPPVSVDMDHPDLSKQQVSLQNQHPLPMDMDNSEFAQEGAIEVLLHINVDSPMDGKDSGRCRSEEDAVPLTEPSNTPQTPKTGKAVACVSRRPITRQMTTNTPRTIATPEEDALGSILGVRRPRTITSPTPESQRKQKRRKKVVFDNVPVIPSLNMRKQLGNTTDLCRPRRKAPSTGYKMWALEVDNHIEKKILESLVPGLCTELKELYKDITSRPHDSQTDVSDTIRNRRKRARFAGSDLEKPAEQDVNGIQKEDIFPNVKRRIEFHQRSSESVDVQVNLELLSTSMVESEHLMDTNVGAIAVTPDRGTDNSQIFIRRTELMGTMETTVTVKPDKINEGGEHGNVAATEVGEQNLVTVNETGEHDCAAANKAGDHGNVTANEAGEQDNTIANEASEQNHVTANEVAEQNHLITNETGDHDITTANEASEQNHVTGNEVAEQKHLITNETGDHDNTKVNKVVEQSHVKANEAGEHDNMTAGKHDNATVNEAGKQDHVIANRDVEQVHANEAGEHDHDKVNEAGEQGPSEHDHHIANEAGEHDHDKVNEAGEQGPGEYDHHIAKSAGESSSQQLGVSEDHLSSQNIAYSLGDSSDHLGLSFLSDSRETGNEAVTESCDAYSDHIGKICEDQNGWASRTRAVAEYIKFKFESMNKEREVKLELNSILKGRRKKEAARMFFETLVLKSSGYIKAEQESEFSNIHILPTERLMATIF